jgi:RNA polymerase sigma-70 factor (ECF subfamily)
MRGKLLPLRRVGGSVDDISDAALLSAVAAGDRSALGALYERFHGDVYRFVGRMARGSAADVDDLVQATFLEAFRSAARFAEKSAVKTWLFGIAVNRLRDHFRREERRARAMVGLASMPAPSRERPDDAASRAQLHDRLASAIDRLSPALRETYVLCAIEEVAAAEAARILGVREGTLWRRLSDARKALRAALEQELR